MSDPNFSMPQRNPRWSVGEPGSSPQAGLPRLGDEAAGSTPASERARATSAMPPTAPSGYEQILAARAMLREAVQHAAATERRAVIRPSPGAVQAGRGAEDPSRRARARRLPPLVGASLFALPALALLTLVWVEPLRSLMAPTSRPGPLVQVPAALPEHGTPASPAAEGETPMFAAADRNAHALAAAGPKAPPGETARPSLSPSEAEKALALLPVAAVGPMDDEPPVVPADVPAEVGTHSPELSGDPGSAPAPTVADAARSDPAPAPTVAETQPAHELPPVPDPALASLGKDLRETAPVEADGPAIGPPEAAPPQHVAVWAPPPPSARPAPTKAQPGRPPPPRAALAAVGDAPRPPAPSLDARCRAIVLKAQLGEETSHADQILLRSGCGGRR